MLILTRKLGEAIIIDDYIIVKVHAITREGHVKLGIDAPRDIAVDREEIHISKKKEREQQDTQDTNKV